MARGLHILQAGQVDSDDLSAFRNDVLKGKTAITNDSDGEIAEGTLELTGTALPQHTLKNYTFYNTDAHKKETGTLEVQSVVNFKAAQYSNLTIICTWALPQKGPWSGLRIMYKAGSYPANINDGTLFYEGSAASAIKTIAKGTWYFRAWNYITTNHGRIYGTYSDYVAANNQIIGSKTFTASGIFTVPDKVYKVDVFCVGAGGGGGSGNYLSSSSFSTGRGGGGGYTTTQKGISVTPGQQLTIGIGSGGKGGAHKTNGSLDDTPGGETYVLISSSKISALGGMNGRNVSRTDSNRYGDGGSGGGESSDRRTNLGAAGGSNGSNGGEAMNGSAASTYGCGKGQGTTTKAFGENNGTLYAGGGASGTGSGTASTTPIPIGGAGGGGNGGRFSGQIIGAAGVFGTGGGGGGGYGIASSSSTGNQGGGGNGGSGICIIRWGYEKER